MSTFETVTLSAVIALRMAAAWTARQLTSSMSLIYGEPSIVRSVPATTFGGATSLSREGEHSFDEVLFRPFSSNELRTANVLHGEQDAYLIMEDTPMLTSKGEAMPGGRDKFREAAVARVLHSIGRAIARYLEKPVRGDEPFTPSDPAALRQSLKPGDVLLVEGKSRISGVIKYLTQSTWSHAALYVGPIRGANTHEGEPHVLIEAEVGEGVVSSPLSKYYSYHTRICRPVGLSQEDRNSVCHYAIERIGFDYDFRNLIDLMRYLIPLPVPRRWRRRMIALGSGNPTRIICSALIAQAFEVVRYPILPKITQLESAAVRREILQIRHFSLCAPRDFDISPYFQIVKPTLVQNFNYKFMDWVDLSGRLKAQRCTQRPGRKPAR